MSHRQATHRPRTKSPRERESTESPAAKVCLQIVDACLLGVIFVAPLFFGGRHPIGRFVFIALACIAAVAWFTHQVLLDHATWTPTKAYAIGVAALLLVVSQLIALPASWIEWLSPRNVSLLTLWNPGTSEPMPMGTWSTLSLTPSSTGISLAMLVAYVLLFVTTVGRLRSFNDVERLLRLLAVSAVSMGVFGLLQHFTSNGYFFWFYEHPYIAGNLATSGTFTCRNHFAHFLVLGMGPLLAWVVLHLQEKKQSQHKQQPAGRKLFDFALVLGVLLVVFAIFLSLSRGGAIALAVVLVFGVTIYYQRGLVSGSFLYSFTAFSLLVVGMLSLYGYEQVSQRLDDFAAGSINELDSGHGRRRIWAANLAAAKQGGLFGAGAGSHREIYPIYLPESHSREYTHAESGPLQIATENGYLGVALLGVTLLSVARWCWQAVRQALSVRQLVAAVAVASGLAASLVHSLIDFVWFIPACMSLTILLASCALRLAQLSASEEVQAKTSKPCSRLGWCGLTLAASLAAVWAMSATIGPAKASTYWDRYLITSKAQKSNTLKLLNSSVTTPEDLEGQRQLSETAIFNLEHTLAYDPNSARANLRLAGRYLQLFDLRQRESDNSMSIDQIRDAAFASQFPSASELRQWLQRAFGDNSELLYQAYWHTQKSLQLCPLQGDGYLYLANLCFLNGRDQKAINVYLGQSLKVRPYDGQVLFEVGRQELLQGRLEAAIPIWTKVFLDKGNHQLQILQLLAGHYPASAFLETFQPNWHALNRVWHSYCRAGGEEDRLEILEYAEGLIESESEKLTATRAAWTWRTLAKMQQTVDAHRSALASFERAIRIDPNMYLIRREYGQALLESQHCRLAETHLRWCYSRKPDDALLHKALVRASNGAISQAANTNSKRR